MGLKRRLWRSTAIGRLIDTTKNVVDEGSLAGGLKRTIKEDITEDSLVGKTIYGSGKFDGEIEGYVKASNEYECKLLQQADLFIQQKNSFEKDREGYENLLDEYEVEINRLSEKNNKTELEKELLQELLLKERKLKTIPNQ